MLRLTRVVGYRTSVLLFALSVMGALAVAPFLAAGQAQAQDGNPALDAIRAEIPEGAPGEDDLRPGDARFGRLVELYGASTAVGDFGTGSVLTGPCGGYAFSYDEDGVLLDAAMDVGDGQPPLDMLDGGTAFTAGNPFKVDTRGLVEYFGFAPLNDEGPMNHSWFIKTSGISLDSGGDPNSAGNNRNEGIVDLAEDLPVKFSAVIKVEGEMTSSNLATCVGQGHVEFIGNGLLDPVGLAGIALLSGGVFGLLFNARPAYTFKG